jgi:hypothetical protein
MKSTIVFRSTFAIADPFLFDNRYKTVGATISLGLHCMPFRAADSRRHRVVALGIQLLRLGCWRGLGRSQRQSERVPYSSRIL